MLFSRKGLYPYPISAKEVYLTYRLQGGLPNPDSMIQALENWAKDWERHGAKISGFQLDFDSPTSGLLRYGDYLKQVRDKLSPKYKLSITGLGDWVLSGDQEALQSIATTVDEIIFQLYQGRKPFTNIDTYIEKFGQLQVEFKVGFLGSSDYQKSVAKLRKNKYFKGAVLFIQK